ncbi:hypothetical protein [Streptomyces sp. NPDC052496]|uniref:hypothetical protein n=1 Tax=Streptomyces sp. NPDC052496 TaxID=3154951 RepID=UPI0034324740
MSRRYWTARIAHFAVCDVAPFAVLAGAAVMASLIPLFGAHGPSSLVDLHSTDGIDSWLAALSVVILWRAFGELPVRKAIDRWYLDGAPPDEWLAFFGLEESWRAPATTASAFRQAHGDPVDEEWDAVEYEIHQNLASREKGDGARTTQD